MPKGAEIAKGLSAITFKRLRIWRSILTDILLFVAIVGLYISGANKY